MPTYSLAELHQQARYNDSYWPLWLALKRRQIEQLLEQTQPVGIESPSSPSDIGASVEVELLRRGRIPLPGDLTRFTLPPPVTVDGVRFWFSVIAEDDQRRLIGCRQLASGAVEGGELLAVAAENGWYVAYAAQQFNLLVETHSAQLVVNAARLWAGFHGQQIPDIRWEPVDAPPTPAAASTAVSWE